jgi:hypothetical protein
MRLAQRMPDEVCTWHGTFPPSSIRFLDLLLILQHLVPNSFPGDTHSNLKETATWTDPASKIWSTHVQKYADPRSYYLERSHLAAKPVLGVTSFVPKNLVNHLMTNKKDAAISVKYRTGDAITNMEGVLHHFVTPFVAILMHGDYAFKGGHSIAGFGTNKAGKQKARVVIMSGLVQQDFENKEVVYEFAKLTHGPIQGVPLVDDMIVPNAHSKANPEYRGGYDMMLKRHAIYHLAVKRVLPGMSEVASYLCLTIDQAIRHIEKLILDATATKEKLALTDVFLVLGSGPTKTYLSLELLAGITEHQMLNEFRVLEHMVGPEQGYVYTWDPASIFAAKLHPTLLNRLTILGVRKAVPECPPRTLKAFAFNDYSDPKATQLLSEMFKQTPHTRHVLVVPKSKLFPPPGLTYDSSIHPDAAQAVLVVRNNSDAFGQNIESEHAGGSMDGS